MDIPKAACGQNTRTNSNSSKKDDFHIQRPTIILPKGGVAFKNIDEKFQVSASNGTASFSIPLPISKTRGEFSPALSLSYNSVSGHGPFGPGWAANLLQSRFGKANDNKIRPAYSRSEKSLHSEGDRSLPKNG